MRSSLTVHDSHALASRRRRVLALICFALALGGALLLGGCGGHAQAPQPQPPQPTAQKPVVPAEKPKLDAAKSDRGQAPATPPVEIDIPVEESAAPSDTLTASGAAKEPAKTANDMGGSGAFMAIGAGAFGSRRAGGPGWMAAPATSEGYTGVEENPFKPVAHEPLSTFSIDVDTASYSNMRRFITEGQRPPKEAVRIEELLNYFPYADHPPRDDKPFAVGLEVGPCPWAAKHQLARISLKGREVDLSQRPSSNLVFLLDVSGSMNMPNKLPWVKRSLRLLVDQLREQDHVAIVVYAGASGLALPPTPGSDRAKILATIDSLQPSGGTNGAGGIRLAYEQARAGFAKGGINRVILCTDGDFNIGVSDPGQLGTLITEEAKSGVFLSVLGFGMGNLKDNTMEALADQGNGNYAYIDSLGEARKVLVEQMAGTLITIAKDVKIQVEFNPSRVAGYRLIGYENRMLAARDFNDDRKDAGEIGAGIGVTALYEVIPVGQPIPDQGSVDPLKYQTPAAERDDLGYELMTVKLRWKQPDGDTSQLMEVPVRDGAPDLEATSEDYRFAAAVAAAGMLLRESPHKGSADWAMVKTLASAGLGGDPHGYRAEFIGLADRAATLK